ncbi:hypothetical protein INR49_016525 [Caranx melampygus]|nr:hypothetical protein INR49_016525 [Caranx melampygus]
MLCEVLLSSLWFLFVIFWVETISVWLFLSMFYQDIAFYHWGDGRSWTDDLHVEQSCLMGSVLQHGLPLNTSHASAAGVAHALADCLAS